jgi:hypothetical protein
VGVKLTHGLVVSHLQTGNVYRGTVELQRKGCEFSLAHISCEGFAKLLRLHIQEALGIGISILAVRSPFHSTLRRSSLKKIKYKRKRTKNETQRNACI